MNFEKYTERARGFVQSAQSLAVREGHQQFTPEHVLNVLLDDEEGLAAGLIDRAGGRSRDALVQTEMALSKLPKVQGSGAGQLYLAPTTARIFDNAEFGYSKVTVERPLRATGIDADRAYTPKEVKALRAEIPEVLYESGKSQLSARVSGDAAEQFAAVVRVADGLLAVLRAGDEEAEESAADERTTGDLIARAS